MTNALMPVNHGTLLASFLARYGVRSQETALKALRRVLVLVNQPQFTVESFPWWELHAVHVSAIRHALQQKVEKKMLSSSSANLTLQFLKGILRECWRHNYFSWEYLQKLLDFKIIPHKKEKNGKHLEKSDILNALLKCQQNNIYGERDSAIIALMAGAGLRRQELVDLAWDNINSDHILLKGKGNKERIVFLADWVKEKLTNWLSLRGEKPGTIFCPINPRQKQLKIGLKISPMQILRIVGKYFNKTIKPHDLRRSFIGQLLDLGVDLSTVAQLAGHQSINTTAQYDHRPANRKKAAIALLNQKG